MRKVSILFLVLIFVNCFSTTIFKANKVHLTNIKRESSNVIVYESCDVTTANDLLKLNYIIKLSALGNKIKNLEINRKSNLVFIVPTAMNLSGVYKTCYEVKGIKIEQ